MNLEQDTKPVTNGWWSWAVWLAGDPAELDQVQRVTYYLHPTFPEPVQAKTNRENGFRLEGNGWGEFTVRARLDFKEGRTEILSLPLRFGDAESRLPRVPTFFISHSLADADTAQTVRQALTEDLHLEFVEPEPPEAGLSLSVESQIQDSDALIAIVSDEKSLWVERDIDLAQRLGVPVVPVVVGSAKLPGKLVASEVIRLDKLGKMSKLAESLEEALSRKHLIAS
jgi:hypothetical protein